MNLEVHIHDPECATNPPAPDQRLEDPHYYIRALNDLLEMGMDITRIVHQEALDYARARTPDSLSDAIALNTQPSQNFITAFDVLARSVRRTATLANSLIRQQKATEAAAPATPKSPKPTPRDAHANANAGAAHSGAERPERPEPPHHRERPERPEPLEPLEDFEDDDRPVAEVIADIYRDFGIADLPDDHPWKQRMPHDIAVVQAQAAKVAIDRIDPTIAMMIRAKRRRDRQATQDANPPPDPSPDPSQNPSGSLSSPRPKNE